jgi:hypothetical protein
MLWLNCGSRPGARKHLAAGAVEHGNRGLKEAGM